LTQRRLEGLLADLDCVAQDSSEEGDVAGLEAFGALSGFELDLLVLLQVAIPVSADGTEVHEHVRAAAVLGDEAVALF
jgi:hypothetical protein